MTEVDVSPVRLMHFTVGWPVAVRGQRQVTLRGRPSPWPEQSITQHRHFSFPSGHSLSACYSSGDTAMLSFLLYPTKSVTPISVSGALLFFFFFWTCSWELLSLLWPLSTSCQGKAPADLCPYPTPLTALRCWPPLQGLGHKQDCTEDSDWPSFLSVIFSEFTHLSANKPSLASYGVHFNLVYGRTQQSQSDRQTVHRLPSFERQLQVV